tara:strand:- start:630 stop:836 length:207 start_codon:yes stop_codon:yes gene_type:complete
MSKDIKIGDKVKLKCYRGDKEYVYYTVVSLPFIEPKTKMPLIKTKADDIPGIFTIPVETIVEVISEEG